MLKKHSLEPFLWDCVSVSAPRLRGLSSAESIYISAVWLINSNGLQTGACGEIVEVTLKFGHTSNAALNGAERRACATVFWHRRVYRYVDNPRDDRAMRQRMKEIAVVQQHSNGAFFLF